MTNRRLFRFPFPNQRARVRGDGLGCGDVRSLGPSPRRKPVSLEHRSRRGAKDTTGPPTASWEVKGGFHLSARWMERVARWLQLGDWGFWLLASKRTRSATFLTNIIYKNQPFVRQT